MQYALGVAVQICHFGAVGVFPKAELVLAEAMRTKDLSVIFVPNERANLTVGVDGINKFAGLDVPETHSLVRSASTSSE